MLRNVRMEIGIGANPHAHLRFCVSSVREIIRPGVNVGQRYYSVCGRLAE
jgi:hypothetical protein